MEKDRRKNSRIKIDAISQFLVVNDERYEGDFEGYIRDISEDSIGILIYEAKYFSLVETLKSGDHIDTLL